MEKSVWWVCCSITKFLCNVLPVTDGGAVPDGFQNSTAEPGAGHFHILTLRQEGKKQQQLTQMVG